MLRFVNRLPFKLDEFVDRDLIDEEEYDDIIDEVFQFDPKELVEKVAAGEYELLGKAKNKQAYLSIPIFKNYSNEILEESFGLKKN